MPAIPQVTPPSGDRQQSGLNVSVGWDHDVGRVGNVEVVVVVKGPAAAGVM